MKKPLIIILLFAVVTVLGLFSNHEWKDHRVATYDASGYYIYLPATFIYKDVGKMDFYPKLDSTYHLSELKWYGLYLQAATGKRLNKYPVGVALGELPLFFVAHSICLVSDKYPPGRIQRTLPVLYQYDNCFMGFAGAVVYG